VAEARRPPVASELLTSGRRYAAFWRERSRAHGWRLGTELADIS
jgi:hypothetical protein